MLEKILELIKKIIAIIIAAFSQKKEIPTEEQPIEETPVDGSPVVEEISNDKSIEEVPPDIEHEDQIKNEDAEYQPVEEIPIDEDNTEEIIETEKLEYNDPLIIEWIAKDSHVKECLDNGSISVEEMIDLLTPAIEEEEKELTEEQIFMFFKDQGLTDAGASGLMGNLYAESGLRSNNLENAYSSKLGYSDEEYTAAVDDGSYTNFVGDSAGYGYAQWTFWSRKQNLLKFAVESGKSIGNGRMQLEFLMKELAESYSSVLTILKCATDVKTASDTVLLKFERPADQSDAVKERRASYGQVYYDKYANK